MGMFTQREEITLFGCNWAQKQKKIGGVVFVTKDAC